VETYHSSEKKAKNKEKPETQREHIKMLRSEYHIMDEVENPDNTYCYMPSSGPSGVAWLKV
jgi:hypothetical protein